MYELDHYLAATGTDLYQVWLNNLRDRSGRARITVRVNRLAAGAFGDCRPVGSGVWELRMDMGPGYRVYYARTGERRLLLLMGGDKDSQDADIRQAIRCWNDYKQRQA